MTNSFQEFKDEFDLLDDNFLRYEYIIELGKKLEPFAESEKNELNFVKGCVSNVWIKVDYNNDKIMIKADSDAIIVKGLCYIVTLIFNNKSKEEILEKNIEQEISSLQLANFLTPNRNNGFYSMIEFIKNKINNI